MATKKFIQMSGKKLNAIMAKRYSNILYDKKLAEKYLKHCALKTTDVDTIIWRFVYYLLSRNLAKEAIEL